MQKCSTIDGMTHDVEHFSDDFCSYICATSRQRHSSCEAWIWGREPQHESVRPFRNNPSRQLNQVTIARFRLEDHDISDNGVGSDRVGANTEEDIAVFRYSF